MGVADSYAAKVSDDVQTEVCPRCGKFHLVRMIEQGEPQFEMSALCVGCGYFKMLDKGIIRYEGVAFLVKCNRCERCESWIRYPLTVFTEDQGVRRLLWWTCDCCGHKMRVSDSQVDVTRAGNWYVEAIQKAKIIRR